MVELQEVQGVGIEDVETATSVHQHFDESGVADDRVDDERVLTGVWDIVGVVFPIEGDRLLRPVEVLRSGYLDREDLPALSLSLTCREVR